MKKYLYISLTTLILFGCLIAENAFSEAIPFDSPRWEIHAQESNITEHLGRKSLYLKGGFAVLKDTAFTNGIIEYDIAFTPGIGFVGAVWRVHNLENFERFYMRIHQSGNPDASQYTPFFNDVSGWQLYHGSGYNAQLSYPFNEWIPVKIVVEGKQAEVYVQDMEKPALFIHDLKHAVKPGKVGLYVEKIRIPIPLPPVYYSNFRCTPMDNPPLKGKPEVSEDATASTVMSWGVSNAFAEKSLAGKARLTNTDKQDLTWTQLDCDASGLANLARVNGIKGGANTAFARITIVSTRDQIKKMEFGFSDTVKVYLNNQQLYAGDDTFRSRDYRFLGTIGFYDELYLPLRTGENELWLAISESAIYLAGWGVQARFENMDGISIKTQ
jgi:hypothetical protein